jgi:EmrB/QacA subfamily drug resistance transporter
MQQIPLGSKARVQPWTTLWVVIIGFFMITLDSTIVSVATPDMMKDLGTDITGVVWVTSAYLLAFVVPLLLTGRLGDRFGQKNAYLAGLTIFTLASLACGLATTLPLLVAARSIQGIGAALIAPQTIAIVVRVFPSDKRGSALAVWGTVGGMAAVVGPLAGGALVGAFGWPWIFFVNIPVGAAGLLLALRYVPALSRTSHRFDLLGVVLSAVGLFLVVLAIQEGSRYRWGQITGIVTIPALIVAGVLVLAAFVVWQAITRGEPLMPLRLFRDRDFTLASIGMSAMGFAITCVGIPLMLYLQNVLRYTAFRSALLMIPMAVVMILLTPVVGKLIGRIQVRYLASFGFACTLLALIWTGSIFSPTVGGWDLVTPSALIGLGSAFVAAPLSTAAFRNLPPDIVGAGSGAFTTLRQVGAVIGSASIAAAMDSLLTTQLPHGTDGLSATEIAAGYAAAMGKSLYLPAAVLLLGFIASIFFTTNTKTSRE